MAADDIRRTLKEVIQKTAGTYGAIRCYLLDAEIVSVDKDNNTCIVNGLDTGLNIDGLTVRLMLTESDGDREYPEIGSTVAIAFTQFTEPYVVRTTDLTEKFICIEKQGWKIDASGQIFNDGGYGGIPIVKDPDNDGNGLKKRLNEIEDKINAVNSRLDSFIQQHTTPNWTVVPNDGGAALQVKIASWLLTPDGQSVSGIDNTTEEQISNPNITHGKKLKDA